MPSRLRRVPSPAYLAGTLATLIALGTVLLRLPAANETEPLGWLDALFTAASAACVTGLVVADPGAQFSRFGELVLLVLMQVGGIGVMTIGTMVILALGQRPSTVVRGMLKDLSAHQPVLRVRDVLLVILATTATVELIGAALLFVAFSRELPPLEALWSAVFHAVSAFCNAGLGLWSDSLTRYATNPLVNFTVMGLVVSGGLGFVVLAELRVWAASRLRKHRAYVRLSLHAKIMLWATAIAIALGAVAVLALETRNTLAGRPIGERLLTALFQSVTARTAGFNTIDTGALTNPTLLTLMGLMFVGAGPGSTAGGIKLTSAAVIVALVLHRLGGRQEIRMFGRAVGQTTRDRAVVLGFLAAMLIGMSVVGVELTLSHDYYDPVARAELLPVLFECVSAFGTVGLSMGITASLPAAAKLIVIGLMFIGRLGPLLLMDFFEHLPPPPPVRYASEDLIVG